MKRLWCSALLVRCDVCERSPVIADPDPALVVPDWSPPCGRMHGCIEKNSGQSLLRSADSASVLSGRTHKLLSDSTEWLRTLNLVFEKVKILGPTRLAHQFWITPRKDRVAKVRLAATLRTEGSARWT